MAALVAAAALALHELRYLIGYGRHADEALAHQGHGYLSWATVLAAVLLALAAAQLVAVLVRARRTGADEGPSPAPVRTWVAASAALVLVYAGQELAEGVLSVGHPDGVAGVVGHGGWVAFPFALAFGALVALALRGAHAAVAAIARRAAGRSLPRAALHLPRPRVRGPWPPLGVLARHLGGRAPPVTS